MENYTIGNTLLINNETEVKLWMKYLLRNKLEAIQRSKTISDKALIILCIIYVSMILLGSIGNALVVWIVFRKHNMRTERNYFIVNLAISDLLLCLFTMPFTLYQIVARYWNFGLITCKLVESLEATSIFVSTISMTSIALDRYSVIVNPKMKPKRSSRTLVLLGLIWIFGLSLSLPILWSRTIKTDNLAEKLKGKIPYIEELISISNVTVEICYEEWPMPHGRAIYSIFTITFQYILPIIIVSTAYTCICKRLKSRTMTSNTQLDQKRRSDQARLRKTNLLLWSTAIIFGISWLPLNIFNMINDLSVTIEDPSSFRIIFACCHMIGMSSACSNPLLYGWLNENFRKEFKHLLQSCKRQSPEIRTTIVDTCIHKNPTNMCVHCLEYDSNKRNGLTKLRDVKQGTQSMSEKQHKRSLLVETSPCP